MTELADIHCHVLPYVDDGAEHLEEMQQLLTEQARQGIRLVCATPHLRHGMFTASDAEIRHQFERARTFIRTQRLPVYLCLSREYHCDDDFLALLEQDRLLPMGNGNTLLVEFSNRHSFEMICDRLQRVIRAGYQPLVAHVERYGAVRQDPARVGRLIGLGAMIQVNASSLLGHEGWQLKHFCWELARQDRIHVVASDAHGPAYRPVQLAACAQKVEHRMGEAYARKVLWENPLKIVSLK